MGKEIKASLDEIAERARGSIEKLRTMQADGNNWVCPKCYLVYEHKPVGFYEDGHGGRMMDMCSCGCDIIVSIDDYITESLEPHLKKERR